MHYRHQAIGGFLIALTAFSGLSSMAEEQADTQALVRDNSTFAIEFYRSLADSRKGNLFFSPHSISTALAMTYAGARGNTEAEMAATLRFQLGQERLHPAFAGLSAMLGEVQKQGNVELRAANSLWPHMKYKFLDEYLALAKKHLLQGQMAT
jgi:serpin B